jgi:gas vesicle protein GvpN
VQPSGAKTSPPLTFVETPFIRDLADRALAYLREGLAVHLSGPAGGGKTTLALHLAHQLGRLVLLMHGDDEIGTADLVGKESGFTRKYTRDNFIHTVLKVEEEAKPLWVEKALTEACRDGYTVVYDEFTRSRPEANNVLLSVLQERVLPLRGGHLPVHPDFRIIFTSNPADYAGVHGVQDALLDRMITIHLDGFDRDTEVAIARASSALPLAEVERIVDLVRAFRKLGTGTSGSSVRPCIMVARILRVRGGHAFAGDPVFTQTCRDVLLSEARRAGLSSEDHERLEANLLRLEANLLRLVQEQCSTPPPEEQLAPQFATQTVEGNDALGQLLQDREVSELLMRKIREKGLAGKLLSDSSR